MNIHFKTALGNMRRSPFQAIAAIFVLALTFFMCTNLAVMVFSSNKVISYFETRPQVISFLKDDATDEQVASLQNKLLSDTRIKDVRYVSKEEALSIYKQATSDNPLLSELVSPSIFPASLEFSLTNLNSAQEIIDQVKTEKIVDQVGFTASLGNEQAMNDVVNRLKTITTYVRVGGGIFVGILTLTSLLVLLVIISMRMASRKQEVEILDLIGATKGFIRSPIMLEAFFYSFIGVLLGWLISFVVWLYLTPNITGYFGSISLFPDAKGGFYILFLVILASEFFIGILLAMIGSILAVARASKRR